MTRVSCVVPAVKGAVLAALLVALYAVAFYVYFGLGPTSRDYDSSWQFARRTSVSILLLGNAVVTPAGGALGWIAGRVRRRRVAVLAVAAPLAGALAWLVGTEFIPGRGTLVLALPGIVLSIPLSLVLERWTRVDAARHDAVT